MYTCSRGSQRVFQLETHCNVEINPFRSMNAFYDHNGDTAEAVGIFSAHTEVYKHDRDLLYGGPFWKCMILYCKCGTCKLGR